MGILANQIHKRGLMEDMLSARRANSTMQSDSGVSVTPNTAMTYSAVYACTQVLADGVGALPCKIYQRLSGGRREAIEHPLYPILHNSPNAEMTAVEFFSMLQGHLAGRGNGYAFKRYDGAGRIADLRPMNPARMLKVERRDGELLYTYQHASGGTDTYTRDDIFHVRGLMGDGLVGYSVIKLARNSIGLGLVTEKHGGKTFANGTRPATVLRHPNKLTETAEANIIESFERRHRGVDNSGLLAVLAEDMRIETIGFSAEDSQFLQTRQHQVTDIARWFKVQPHLIGDLSRSTNNNIEQQSLDFVIHTIRPWLVRWEQAINMAFFAGTDYYVEFLVDALLRADSQARAEYFSKMFSIGAYSINDIREKDNKNPIPGGDVHLVPLNMIPLTDAILPEPSNRSCGCGTEHRAIDSESRAGKTAAAKRGVKERNRIRKRYQPLFEDFAGRIAAREKADIMRKAEKILKQRSVGNMLEWLDTFYRDKLPGYIAKQAKPTYEAFVQDISESAAKQIGTDVSKLSKIKEQAAEYSAGLGLLYSERALARVGTVIKNAETDGADVLPELESEMENRIQTQPGKVYRWESVFIANAVSAAIWQSDGFRSERWVSSANCCPACAELDGVKTSIEGAYVKQGSGVDGGDDQGIVTVSRDIIHPPLHDACECGTAPE